jgi:condensin complex subunit 1
LYSLSDALVPCTYLGLAKLFFAELAKKGNTLYNVMPDIVSRLSDPEVGIAEDQFR